MAGIFDPALKHLERAPVDEFFAGPNSALIDDKEWAKSAAKAERELRRSRGGKNLKKGLGNALIGYALTGSIPINTRRNGNLNAQEGSEDDKEIRQRVHDKTGMLIYPGHGIDTPKEDVVFMREFDDSGASLADGWRDAESLPPNLGGLLQHPTLFEHYPELADMPLTEERDPRFAGSYGGISEENPMGYMTVARGTDDNEVLKTILHEAQHYIQKLEGWPAGGTPGSHNFESYSASNPEMAQHIYSQWQNAKSPNDADAIESEAGVHTYQNISGEILARDVEARFDKRNELNNARASLLDPEHPHFNPDRTQSNKERLLGSLDAQIRGINSTYPYKKRDMSNSFPHDMSSGQDVTPMLIKAAMGSRENDKYADSTMRYADSLLRDAFRGKR